ncbi:acyltransferase family protein [Rhodanobacter aciditrophus]|uniref:Acyltransferase family protein n=1 Tax=Rhodanobacter aciditrophus TaxID=1623218 RepID=A0ABW4AY49_9GAMM
MQRSHLLDLLRIFAIVLVFVAHFGQLLDSNVGQFFGVKNFYYVSLGGVGVSLFLVLSGLLAGLTGLARPTPYTHYIWKKLKRIYPIYWLTIPFCFSGYLLKELLLGSGVPEPFPNGFMLDIVGSVTGLYAWIGLWGGPYNPPSWFIGLILTMYLIFPLLAACLRRAPHLTLGLFFFISASSRWYVGQYGLPFTDKNMLDQVEGWLYRQYGFMPGRPGDWFPLCRLFEFALGIWLAQTVSSKFWCKWNLGKGKWLAFLSDLSFPLFLLHYPFLFIVPWLSDLGMAIPLAISLFMIMLCSMAYAVVEVEKRLFSLKERATP